MSDIHTCSDGHAFPEQDGFVNLLPDADRGEAAEEVTDFYRRFPFPGYRPSDDAAALIDRSRAAPFLASLDDAIPGDAVIADLGCGTGQLAAFLALRSPRRSVIGVDACDASLAAAAAFRKKVGIPNLHHFRGDLFRLPLTEESFDVVISRGVVHHTPDPSRAPREVAARVKPGGILVIGFYERIARLPHRTRRRIFQACGRPVRFLDPVLRRRDFTEEKKQIWIEDAYRHPLERLLPFTGVLAELESQGFTFVRSVPPVCPGQEMFRPTRRPGSAGFFWRRLGWAWAGFFDPDAGLVCLIAKKGTDSTRQKPGTGG